LIKNLKINSSGKILGQ